MLLCLQIFLMVNARNTPVNADEFPVVSSQKRRLEYVCVLALYISLSQSFVLQVILPAKHFIVTDPRHTKCSTEAWVPYEKCVGQTACLY